MMAEGGVSPPPVGEAEANGSGDHDMPTMDQGFDFMLTSLRDFDFEQPPEVRRPRRFLDFQRFGSVEPGHQDPSGMGRQEEPCWSQDDIPTTMLNFLTQENEQSMDSRPPTPLHREMDADITKTSDSFLRYFRSHDQTEAKADDETAELDKSLSEDMLDLLNVFTPLNIKTAVELNEPNADNQRTLASSLKNLPNEKQNGNQPPAGTLTVNGVTVSSKPDFTLISADGVPYNVHREFLDRATDFFKEHFQGSDGKTFRLWKVNSTALRVVVNGLYGRPVTVTHDNICDVYYAIRKLRLRDMWTNIERFFLDCLHSKNDLNYWDMISLENCLRVVDLAKYFKTRDDERKFTTPHSEEETDDPWEKKVRKYFKNRHAFWDLISDVAEELMHVDFYNFNYNCPEFLKLEAAEVRRHIRTGYRDPTQKDNLELPFLKAICAWIDVSPCRQKHVSLFKDDIQTSYIAKADLDAIIERRPYVLNMCRSEGEAPFGENVCRSREPFSIVCDETDGHKLKFFKFQKHSGRFESTRRVPGLMDYDELDESFVTQRMLAPTVFVVPCDWCLYVFGCRKDYQGLHLGVFDVHNHCWTDCHYVAGLSVAGVAHCKLGNEIILAGGAHLQSDADLDRYLRGWRLPARAMEGGVCRYQIDEYEATQNPQGLPARIVDAAMTNILNNLYLAGGNDVISTRNNFFVSTIDPSARFSQLTWTELAPMLYRRSRFSLDALFEKLYAVGGTMLVGYVFFPIGHIEYYDLLSEQWNEIETEKSFLRVELHGSYVKQNCIYIIGGKREGSNSASRKISYLDCLTERSCSLGVSLPYRCTRASSANMNFYFRQTIKPRSVGAAPPPAGAQPFVEAPPTPEALLPPEAQPLVKAPPTPQVYLSAGAQPSAEEPPSAEVSPSAEAPPAGARSSAMYF